MAVDEICARVQVGQARMHARHTHRSGGHVPASRGHAHVRVVHERVSVAYAHQSHVLAHVFREHGPVHHVLGRVFN
jgi:hypothetical protein